MLNSGSELKNAIETPAGSLAYGKLLYGGVRRFRLLPGGRSGIKRRASERTAIKTRASDNIPSWIQYGGPDRKYKSVDMGAAGNLEVYILPQGKTLTSITSDNQDMALSKILWHPDKMFSFIQQDNNLTQSTRNEGSAAASNVAIALTGKDRNDAFKYSFKSRVGGLNTQIESIVRRVLDGRVIRPADEEIIEDSNIDLTKTAMEAETLAQLGLSPVKGKSCGCYRRC